MFDILAWVIGGILVLGTVSIHYETMLLVSDRVVPWAVEHLHGRRVIAIAIATLMLGHIVEIWLWAFAYMGMTAFPLFGRIDGTFDHAFSSYLYFSAVSFTSLGDNNMHPAGALRCVTASETLAGLMMTAWSASFTYLKMEQLWQRHKKKGE